MPLRLIGHEPDDVTVISSLMQDAAVVAADAHYDAPAHRFVLIANRYRWEATGRTRVRSALRIECVLDAKRRNWPGAPESVLELLAIRRDGEAVLLDFAGGASVRLEVECLDLVLEDLTGPWGAMRRPEHGSG